MACKGPDQLAIGHAPEPDNSIITTGGQELTIRAESHRSHPNGMPEHLHYFAIGRPGNLSGAVNAAARDLGAIRAEFNIPNLCLVNGHLLPGRGRAFIPGGILDPEQEGAGQA
jgi:hypothetical protein